MSKKKQEGKITLGLDYELEVTKDGKVLSKYSKKNGELDPFVTNAIRMLKAVFASTGTADTISLTDVAGVSKTFEGSGYPVMSAIGLATEDTIGPVVGTSELAFVRTQYQLDGKIAHGSGAGQLLYGAVTVEAATEENNTGRFRIIRGFTNSTGSSITVKEIAIDIYNDSPTASFMLCRDVLASPQTIPDGATLTLRYRMYVSYV